jgi:hypothetical protein
MNHVSPGLREGTGVYRVGFASCSCGWFRSCADESSAWAAAQAHRALLHRRPDLGKLIRGERKGTIA